MSKRSGPPRWMASGSTVNKGQTGSDSMVSLSKSLSWLLRHSAETEKLVVHDGGFVNVPDILGRPNFVAYTVDHIKKVVETNDKQRFALRVDEDTGILQIRANQGHSYEVKNLAMTPIEDASRYPVVIHGTYLKHLNSIKRSGLSRMKRTHMHFASGLPGENGVISGMRNSAEVLIYIDLEKAMKDGINFFVSENNVILTSGNEAGFLEPKYFASIVTRP